MAALADMSSGQRVGLIVGVAVLITVAAYFMVFKTMQTDNDSAQVKLNERLAQNERLKQYEPMTRQLESQIAGLKQQLEVQKSIVPDEKEAPEFIHIIQNSASQSGVQVRRFTPKPVLTREFYTEVPFEVDLDGTYYQVLDFFNRVAKLQRIVNVDNLQMTAIGPTGTSKAVKRNYVYGPKETVAVGCVARSFYSHDAPQPAPVPPGATPAKK